MLSIIRRLPKPKRGREREKSSVVFFVFLVLLPLKKRHLSFWSYPEFPALLDD